MFYDILQGLCLERGLTVSAALKIMGLSSGNMARWRAGNDPGGKTLRRIAQFFDVPIDFLIGKRQNAYAVQQKKLLALFETADESEREEILSAIESRITQKRLTNHAKDTIVVE